MIVVASNRSFHSAAQIWPSQMPHAVARCWFLSWLSPYHWIFQLIFTCPTILVDTPWNLVLKSFKNPLGFFQGIPLTETFHGRVFCFSTARHFLWPLRPIRRSKVPITPRPRQGRVTCEAVSEVSVSKENAKVQDFTACHKRHCSHKYMIHACNIYIALQAFYTTSSTHNK